MDLIFNNSVIQHLRRQKNNTRRLHAGNTDVIVVFWFVAPPTRVSQQQSFVIQVAS